MATSRRVQPTRACRQKQQQPQYPTCDVSLLHYLIAILICVLQRFSLSDSYQLHVLHGIGEQGKTYGTAMSSTKLSSSVLDQEDDTIQKILQDSHVAQFTVK